MSVGEERPVIITMKNSNIIQEHYDAIKLLWKDVKQVSEKTQESNCRTKIDSLENPLEPHLLGYCFHVILGFDIEYRPFEKTNYRIGFEYKGMYAYALHKKLEYSIYLDESVKKEFIEILKQTKTVLNQAFQYIGKDSIRKNQFTLINYYRQYKDKLNYDEEKIDKLYELQKVCEKEGKCLFSFLEDCENTSKLFESMGWLPNKEWQRLTYELEGYINDYYSYLEHLLTLLIPFSADFDETRPYKEIWNKSWIQKLEMVWDKDSIDSGLLESLKRYKEIYRNRNVHGMFSRETKAYVQIPKLGRYLMGIGDNYLKGFLDDEDVYLSINKYQEMKKNYRQFDEFVWNTYPIAMILIESGLEISVDIKKRIENVHTVEDAKKFVERQFYFQERTVNMDW